MKMINKSVPENGNYSRFLILSACLLLLLSFGIVLPAMARAVGEKRRQWALGLGTAAGSIGQFVKEPSQIQNYRIIKKATS
jgi:hypothetical protein